MSSLSMGNAFAQTRWHEGSRPSAMGGAFLAVSNDVNGLAFNPAGLVYAPQQWLAEFSLQNPFGAGLPFRDRLRNEGVLTASSFGVVYNHLHHPNQTQPMLVFRGDDLPPGLPAQAPTSNRYSVGVAGSFFNSGLMNQFFLGASLSKGFFEKSEASPATNHLSHTLAVSVTAKLSGMQYDSHIAQNAEVNSEEERMAIQEFFAQHGHNRFGFGIDLGVMAELHPRVHAALSWTNALRPETALQGSASAPRTLRSGLALLLHERRRLLLALDYEQSHVLPKRRIYVGAESGLPKLDPNVLRMRLGVNRNWLAAGFMLAKPSFAELHYAFMLPMIFSEDRPEGFFQHRFSIAFAKLQ
ncbi:hypothetical protein HUU05_14160 [candidate division KSB1 bacterium]|nr:hypothetical protein [candidate division KSB1 bacterium]